MVKINQQDAQSLVGQVKNLCQNIGQVFRIRLMCLKKRHELLQGIASNFDNIPKRINFYKELETNLRREQKVIAALAPNAQTLNGLLKKTIDFTDYVQNFYKVGPVKYNDSRIKLDDLEKLLTSINKFLAQAEQDIKLIQQRMQLEENLLREAENSDPQGTNQSKARRAFNEFLKTWEAELQENERLVSKFITLTKSNLRIINQANQKSFLSEGERLTVSIGTGTAGYAAFAAILLNNPTRDQVELALAALVVPIAIATTILLYRTGDSLGQSVIYFNQDKKLIRMLKREGLIDQPFYRKILGI